MLFLNAAKELATKNREYVEALNLFIWEPFLLDSEEGDITTKYFLKNRRKMVMAQVISNTDAILAGIEEVLWFLKKLKIDVLKSKKDGSSIKNGEVVMQIQGPAYKILAIERTLLNLLQRMSGIATKTKKIVAKLPKSIQLLATRKTLWGPLDKKAVVVGGGGTHRLNLSDAILIKDNHLFLSKNLKKDLKRTLKRIKKCRFIEIELESTERVDEFLKVYNEVKKVHKGENRVVVMLDNFKPAAIKKIVPRIKKAGLVIEISGGISERNISRYGIKGINAISSGSLTMNADSIDMSLSFIGE